MRVFTTLMTAAALLLSAPGAMAQSEEIRAQPVGEEKPSFESGQGLEDQALRTNQGWDSDWALHFSFTNWFTNNNLLNNFLNFGIGGSYHLSSAMALRGGVSFGRTTNAPTITKVTNQTAAETLTTYNYTTPNPTSGGFVSVRADVLYRLMQTAVAPYAGAGLFVDYSESRRKQHDDVSVIDVVSGINNRSTNLGLGVRGILGAEWRLHPNFAFYAEYGVNVTVFSQNTVRNETTLESTQGGERSVSRTLEESSRPQWFAISSGLNHGAQLGLAVHF